MHAKASGGGKKSKIATERMNGRVNGDASDLLSIKRQLGNYLRYLISESFAGNLEDLNTKLSWHDFEFYNFIFE